MTSANAPRTTVERLAHYLFDGAAEEPMSEELATWMAGSARFRDFVDGHRDKIRKKLRTARAVDARRDVRAELQVAHLLLADRRIELAFEAYGSAKGGPDFFVAYRGERGFNLEVTRLRRTPDTGALGGSLLVKVRQLPPSAPNAVLVAVEAASAESIDIAAAVQALRTRANARDEILFSSRGFDGSRGFMDRLRRLGTVVAWSESAPSEDRTARWTNQSARIAVPERALRACLRCLNADDTGTPLGPGRR